jgi:excisionase family DNA binding protein
MKSLQFVGLNPTDFKEEILKEITSRLEDYFKNFKPHQPNDYLSRKEVAEMLDVDLSTIHNWCKKGKLKPLGLGNRVYFLRSEVEASLTPLNPSL